MGYTRDSKGRVSSYHEKDVANTIHTTTGGGGNTDQFIIQKPRGFNKGGAFDISPTITSNAWQENNFCCDKTYIRKLTPRECFRLMGVSEDDIDKIQTCHWLSETNLSYSKEERKKTMDNSTKKKLAKQGISNTQQYKMAGNSIVVDVLVKIFEQMFCSNSQKMTLFG